MNTQPLRRSNELVSLSRDHHHGLLLGWKIRNGLKAGVEPGRIAAYIAWFYGQDLQEHFRQEEEIVFPLIPASHTLVVQALEQHRQLAQMAAGIAREPLPDAMLAFAELLDSHIRLEERQLFPYIEQTADKQKLTEAGTQLDDLPHSKSDLWDDPFWVKTR